MTDRESVSVLADEDPVGAMRLATTVKFGQRAAALSGMAGSGDGTGIFELAGSITWPDHPTCSSVTL